VDGEVIDIIIGSDRLALFSTTTTAVLLVWSGRKRGGMLDWDGRR
jgi:hypothetical protein